jgi:hypothetical protein
MLRTILVVQKSNSCPSNVKSKPFIAYMSRDYPTFATCLEIIQLSLHVSRLSNFRLHVSRLSNFCYMLKIWSFIAMARCTYWPWWNLCWIGPSFDRLEDQGRSIRCSTKSADWWDWEVEKTSRNYWDPPLSTAKLAPWVRPLCFLVFCLCPPS